MDIEKIRDAIREYRRLDALRIELEARIDDLSSEKEEVEREQIKAIEGVDPGGYAVDGLECLIRQHSPESSARSIRELGRMADLDSGTK